MDFRKQAKESRTKKLHQLTVSAPDAKTDASDFTPYADPKMDKKTGKRPINPRNFKRGGKVAALEGAAAKKRGDRVGAKGRSKKMLGGDITAGGNAQIPSAKGQTSLLRKAVGLDYKSGGRAKKAYGGRGVGERTQMEEARRAAVKAGEDYGVDPRVSEDDLRKATRNFEQKKTETAYKKGGAIKKMNGGPMMAGPAQTLMKRKMPMNNPAAKAPAVMPMRAKGGKVSEMEWEHSKKDLAEDKKLAKKHGMSLEKWEKSAADKKHDKQQSTKGLMCGGRTKKDDGGGAGMRSEYTEAAKALNNLRTANREVKKIEKDREDSGAGFFDAYPENYSKLKKIRGKSEKVANKVYEQTGYVPPTLINNAAGITDAAARERLKNAKMDFEPEKKPDSSRQRSEYTDQAKANEAWRASKSKVADKTYYDAKKSANETGYDVTSRFRPNSSKSDDFGYAKRLEQAPTSIGEDEMKRGGRTKKRAQRASGGRAKGKSNINIVIAPQPAAQGPMPMGGMPPRPPMPMPMPPAPGGAPGGMPPGAGAMPMPMPVPVPMGGGAPAPQGAGVPGIPGMAPLPRKSGGRVKSFKDMTAGAGSGEGRLQKEEMQEYKRTARKAGGKVPNMTFGAGSGPGRIEKIHAYGENPHGEAAPKPKKRSWTM